MSRTTKSWVRRVTALVWFVLAPNVAVGQSSDRPQHVRALDPMLRRLLDEGIDRSGTFRRLVERIDGTDGIVYVENGTCSIGAAMGCLLLAVREAGHTRYLTIHLPRRKRHHDERIAMIGHELQHATEVLTAGWVRNRADAHALFTRIGSAQSIRSFETAEAQRVGELVARELALHPK